ncbi:MAG: hypothetical protein R3E39_21840 [Anaerolineae bacterium]
MIPTYKKELELRRRRDNAVMARLHYKRSEFPTDIYYFEPTEAFEVVRHVFEAERAQREQVYMNEDDINAWGKTWQALMREFCLVAVGETLPLEGFMMNIEGEYAFLRV